MAELTPENFIDVIKGMSNTDRNKIKKEDLIKLILAAPSKNFVSEESFHKLLRTIQGIQTQMHNNTAQIANLQTTNDELRQEIISLKENREEMNQEMENLKKKNVEYEQHFNNIEQYLRVNNLEVVGYPDVPQTADYEECMINIINKLPGLAENQITKDDIDVCHPVQTERKDRKNVGIVRFTSRKTKFRILQAKKDHGDLQFNGQSIFINEHLSPHNRMLFAEASSAKKNFGYKHLWVKNGTIFMRKADRSDLLRIETIDNVRNLDPALLLPEQIGT